MKRNVLAVLVLAVLLSGTIAVLAEKQILLRKNGEVLVGEITLKDGVYEVKADGGVLTVPADQVASVKPYVSPADEYALRRGALKADDWNGHYQLGRWCMKKNLNSRAKTQFKRVLAVKSDHENAKLYLELLEAQGPSKPPKNGTTTDPRPKQDDYTRFLMTEKDMQRIRLTELKSTDRVTVLFKNKALDRFIEKMKARGKFSDRKAEAAFRRQKPVARALRMAREFPDDTELLGDLQIRGDGPFMRTFKTRVWPAIERNCGKCHGKPTGAGKLKLYVGRPAKAGDRFYFTNFFILDSYVSRAGRGIDRNTVGNSLLLQYGLPKGVAKARHPKEQPRSMFRTTGDPSYRLINTWIRELRHPHPGYEVKYLIPGAKRPKSPAGGRTSPPKTGRTP